MKWDVKKDDPIEYFDRDLSYELTGYRPIDDKNGLDFNPDWFRADAINKINTKHYTNINKSSPRYRTFVLMAREKCRKGYTSHGYTITGDNYFFLNFYRLKSASADTSSGVDVTFPDFVVFQYEFFHYFKICEILKKNIAVIKARGLGFSEMMASIFTGRYSVYNNYRSVLTADSENHLKPLLRMAWNEMSYLNNDSDGIFKHVRMVKDDQIYKRASYIDGDGNEKGPMSEIQGIAADDPNKIRGDRVELLGFEEFGSNKYSKLSWIQGDALIHRRFVKTGIKIGWGTGGDKGPNLQGLREIIASPKAFGVLPLKHKYTRSGEYAYTGYFEPATRNIAQLTDKRGYCNPDDGARFLEKEHREMLIDNPSDLLTECAENCIILDEAYGLQGEGGFPPEVRANLATQKINIEIKKTTPRVTVGFLNWIKGGGEEILGVKFIPDPKGNIHIAEFPLKGENDEKYKNLYVGGIDSIDMGKDDTSESNKSGSDFCIVIKRRMFGLSEESYVAYYKERPTDVRFAYENAAKLLWYYNCKANLEYTRITLMTYFKTKKWERFLMLRPKIASESRSRKNVYGTPATEKIIRHQLDLICNFLLDHCETLCFPEFVDQFATYSYEQKRKFDIVAAVGMAELADEELDLKSPVIQDKINREFKNIGYYKDDRGYTRFGAIPNDRLRNPFDYRSVRESNLLNGKKGVQGGFFGQVWQKDEGET